METRAPTTDQLRARTDSSTSTDKIDFPDPAAAPLGTDAEAAGASPSPLERNMAAAQPTAGYTGTPDRGLAIYPFLIAAIVAIVIVAAVLAFRS